MLGARVSVDWFHSALEIDTRILMIVMVICYLVPVFGFAWLWVWISDVAPHCMDPPAYFYIDGLYMSIQVRGLGWCLGCASTNRMRGTASAQPLSTVHPGSLPDRNHSPMNSPRYRTTLRHFSRSALT